MFEIDKNARTITLSRGDTGWVPYRITGKTLGEDDRVLWTMRNAKGQEIKKQIYTPVDNVFWVRFENPETDGLPPGTYTYDARVIIGPIYDANDNIVDGEEVKTPMLPTVIRLLDTVGIV